MGFVGGRHGRRLFLLALRTLFGSARIPSDQVKTSGDCALRGGERLSSPLMAAPQVSACIVAAPRTHLSVRPRSNSLAPARRLCARPFVVTRLVCTSLLLQCIELELALSWRLLDLMPGLAFRRYFAPAPCFTIRSGLQLVDFHNVVAFSTSKPEVGGTLSQSRCSACGQ